MSINYKIIYKKNISQFFLLVLPGIVGVFCTILVFYIKGYINFGEIDAPTLSAFSSFVGGFIGVFFTLVTSFLVWSTYMTQKEELFKARESTKLERFENTYFKLLSSLREIIQNMKSNTEVMGTPEINGTEYLHWLYRKLNSGINAKVMIKAGILAQKGKTSSEMASSIKELIVGFYEDNIFAYHSYNLGHYFRSVHNIIKYVRSELEDVSLQKKYLSFLQAQMSNDEMGLILINSLSDFSLDKDNQFTFRQWVDFYNILENIDIGCVFDESILKEYFPQTNFFCLRKK